MTGFVRSGGEDLIRELWPGPEQSLALIIRRAVRSPKNAKFCEPEGPQDLTARL
jgi:hypothetical protein